MRGLCGHPVPRIAPWLTVTRSTGCNAMARCDEIGGVRDIAAGDPYPRDPQAPSGPTIPAATTSELRPAAQVGVTCSAGRGDPQRIRPPVGCCASLSRSAPGAPHPAHQGPSAQSTRLRCWWLCREDASHSRDLRRPAGVYSQTIRQRPFLNLWESDPHRGT
ncbi:hypothetical protein C0Z11_00160 [Acidipropionibacterium jensenii]|nr:hypothetical protein C0Z11_00160 [Acidipropionibacterium jensenii]